MDDARNRGKVGSTKPLAQPPWLEKLQSMPEYTFDPALGEAVETRGGNFNPGRNVYESAAAESQSMGTQEELQDVRMERTANNLRRRANEDYVANGQVADEDLDRGTYSPTIAAKQAQLEAVQAKAAKSNNPNEIAALQAEAWQLAEYIVKGRGQSADYDNVREDESAQEVDEEIRLMLGDSFDKAVDAIKRVKTDEEIEVINNEILANEDVMVRDAGAKALKTLAERPDAITNERQAITQSQYNDLQERYGSHTADMIHTVSHAVARGLVTPSQAFATVARDPRVLQALMQEAASGRMQMMM